MGNSCLFLTTVLCVDVGIDEVVGESHKNTCENPRIVRGTKHPASTKLYVAIASQYEEHDLSEGDLLSGRWDSKSADLQRSCSKEYLAFSYGGVKPDLVTPHLNLFHTEYGFRRIRFQSGLSAPKLDLHRRCL